MRQIIETAQFKRDLKRIAKSRNHNKSDFLSILELLATDRVLPAKYRDHNLSGNWLGYREIHIKPDWLLIYKKLDQDIFLVRMGSHSDLFK